HAPVMIEIQGISNPDESGQGRDAFACGLAQCCKLLMRGAGECASVIARDTSNLKALLFGKAGQRGLFNQAVTMFVVAAYLYEHAGIVQECGAREQAPALLIEF